MVHKGGQGADNQLPPVNKSPLNTHKVADLSASQSFTVQVAEGLLVYWCQLDGLWPHTGDNTMSAIGPLTIG